MPTRIRDTLIAALWVFVQREEETIPAEMKTTKKEVEEAVFAMDGKVRVSGEVGNRFRDFYVNYFDGEEMAAEMLFYLAKRGFEMDWGSPAYMVVGCN